MTSIQALVGNLQGLKMTGDQLSTMVAGSADVLGQQSQQVMSIVQGSATGRQAVGAIANASRALRDAASAMLSLGRSCDDCIRNLQK